MARKMRALPMVESAVASKGRTTLPKAVREALGVAPGDRVRYVISDSNEVRIIPVRHLMRLFGAFRHEGQPISLQAMERAVADGSSDS